MCTGRFNPPGNLTARRDYATYNPNLTVASNGTYTPTSSDHPKIIQIGKSFFESFQTWLRTQYAYGFNFAVDKSTGQRTLSVTTPLACEALQHGRLAYWEMGNEPDLYKTSAQGVKRRSAWNEQDYVDQWHANTINVKHIVSKVCSKEPFRWMAPSFAGTKNSLDPVRVWQAGLGNDKDVKIFSSHKCTCC